MLKVPLTNPFFDQKEEAAVIKVLRSGWHTQGPQIIALEEEFSKFTSSDYSVAVSSCTTALHLSLLIVGVKKGDEVLVPSYTFIATANAIMYIGAKPVFVDVDAKTFNINPENLEDKITKKTKAIIIVDQVGLPCDIDSIKKIAQKHDLIVIEDAACSLGSLYKGSLIGGLVDITCFSFHPRKLISSGEGGMITTNNKSFADKARILRSHGATISDRQRHSSKKNIFEQYEILGYNYRLTDIQAAIIREQLKKMSIILKNRKNIADRYSIEFSNISSLQLPFVPSYATHNWQSYLVKILNNKISQADVMENLLQKGIATRKGVMACHMEPIYKKIVGDISLPVTEKLSATTIALPIFPQMTESQQVLVVDSIKDIFS